MVAPLLTAVEEEIAAGRGLEGVLRRLPDLLGAMDDARFADLLNRLAFSARLSGRVDTE